MALERRAHQAGIFSAVVAVLALLWGIFVYVVPGQQSGSGSDATSSGDEAPGADSGEQSPRSVEAWQGTMLFDDGGVDFDTDPPTKASSPDPRIDAYNGDGSIVTYGWTLKNVARWSGEDAPNAEDCAGLLQTHAVYEADYDKGSRFCVRSRGLERIVFVEFLEPIDTAWEIQVTVWNTRA
ncbi:hypothetical protein [Phytomonospora endophytica]|uniref:Uncharacterized protein n=1 Tax=Phytomonospora endophytica TaxID=714109 RepID=A0A841FVB4_9ACTN|nr:hypothetical protein [Phytomonospora endophytica]MBB6037668.1 hypothetical protein [Phytomonospora endophytica]GIG67806.1 hypothetical protein Pen01_41010 [Phytomonospora endophytica]